MITLTETEFDALFTPVESADGNAVRPVRADLDTNSRNFWTIIEGDDGSLWASSGYHSVNVVGYLITEEPWDQDTQGLWSSADPEDWSYPDPEDPCPRLRAWEGKKTQEWGELSTQIAFVLRTEEDKNHKKQ